MILVTTSASPRRLVSGRTARVAAVALLALALAACGGGFPTSPAPPRRIVLDTAWWSHPPAARDAPDGRLAAPQPVEVLEAAGPWDLVRLQDGRVVWVPMAAVGPAAPDDRPSPDASPAPGR